MRISELLPLAESDGVTGDTYSKLMGLVRARGGELGKSNFAKLDFASAGSNVSFRVGRNPTIYPFLTCENAVFCVPPKRAPN